MDDIEDLILNAWDRIKPRLLEDPAELARRLARRNSRSLSRPPRAWCLAIRASDRRINDYQNSPPHAGGSMEVVVDFHLLDDLCRPVKIPWGGDSWDAVAKSLGVGFTGLINARLSGKFRTDHVRGLEGRFGPPVPMLSCNQSLDPNARGFEQNDPAWGWTGSFMPKRIPFDFVQCLTRVPVYHPRVARKHFDDSMHPEVRDGAARKERARLPPPEPDYVWYKWSWKGEYLGDDPKYWRKSPQDPGTPPPAQALKKIRRRRKRKEALMRGSLVFRGWMWVCPKCGKKVKVMYLPLKAMNLLADELPVVSCQLPEGEGAPPELATGNWSQATSFACFSCHRIRCFSRADAKNSWNELVSYLSGGLLYGHEVERPEWFVNDARRKVSFRPRARPAPRRQQVLRRMLNGWTIMQIASDLKMCKQQVCDCIRKLCRQEGVKNRRELAAKLGSTHFQPMDSDRRIIHRRDAKTGMMNRG